MNKGKGKVAKILVIFILSFILLSSGVFADITFKQGTDDSGQSWSGPIDAIKNSNGRCWEATGENLQLAIWNLNDTGGTVLVDENLTITSSISVVNDTVIDFQGHSVTLIGSAGFHMIEIGDGATGITDVEIMNGYFFGNRSNQASLNHCIYIQDKCERIDIHHNYFTGWYGKAVFIEGGAFPDDCYFISVCDNEMDDFEQGVDSDGIDFDQVQYGTIANNIIKEAGDDGIDIGAGGSINIDGNIVRDCLNGIELYDTKATVVGNTCDNLDYYGIVLDSCKSTTVNGNYIYLAGYHGIRMLYARSCSVVGNTLWRCSSSGDNTYDSIHLESKAGDPCTNNTIIGNTIFADGANKVKYGINESDSDQDYNIILGNSITGPVTGSINKSGAHSLVGYNQGYESIFSDVNFSTAQLGYAYISGSGLLIKTNSGWVNLTGESSYSAGSGLNLSGDVFSINGSIWGDNLTWDGSQVNASLTGVVDGYFNVTKIWNSNGNNWTATAANLQLAIYDTNGSSDKWVMFPSMDLDQSIQTTDGLTLMGYSKSTTLTGTGSKRSIYADGVSNVTLKDFSTRDYVQIRPYVDPGEIQRNIYIENINGYNISDNFIFVTCDGGILDTLVIKNCKVNGTGIHGFHHDSPNDGSIRNLIVSDCVFSYCGADVSTAAGDWAVGFNLCENGSVDGAMISNCIFEYCWESGFHSERNAVTKDVVVTNCISRNNGMKNDYSGGYDHGTYGYGAFYGAGFKVSSNISFVNCKASDNRYGFHASCMNGTGYRFVHNVSISDCEIKNCDNGTGIYLPYIVNLIVDSCRIHNVTNTSYYGISLYDAKKVRVRDCDIFDVLRCIDVNIADNITISDNDLSDTDGSCIYNIPSNSDIIIFDSIGYNNISLFPFYEQTSAPTIADNCTAWWYDTNNVLMKILVNTHGTTFTFTNGTGGGSDGYAYDGEIHNSNGNSWAATGGNVQLAVWDLNDTGGTVWLPGNTTFTFTSDLDLDDDITLEGQGYSTVLNFTDACIRVQDDNNTVLRNFRYESNEYLLVRTSDGDIHNITLENIDATVTNYSGSVTDGTFYVFAAAGDTVENIKFINCRALYSDCIGFIFTGTGSTDTIKDVLLENCVASHCGLESDRYNDWVVGFDLGEGISYLENMTVANCKAEYNWESGFHIENAVVCKNVIFDACISNYNGQDTDSLYGSGFYLSGEAQVSNSVAVGNNLTGIRTEGDIIIGCSIEGSDIGIKVVGINCTIMGNNIDNTTKGIYVDTNMDGNIIIGNRINDSSEKGIELWSSDNNLVSTNYITSAVTAISEGGTSQNNIIESNYGYEHDYTDHQQHLYNTSASNGWNIYVNATGVLIWEME